MSDPEPIASETPEADDAGKMSFFDHLTELRTRIIWSLIPSAGGLAIAFYFTDRIMVFLQRPLANLKTPPIFLTPTEYFWVDHQSFLVSCGYKLRPRYDPERIPSWKRAEAKHGRTLGYEDGTNMLVS